MADKRSGIVAQSRSQDNEAPFMGVKENINHITIC